MNYEDYYMDGPKQNIFAPLGYIVFYLALFFTLAFAGTQGILMSASYFVGKDKDVATPYGQTSLIVQPALKIQKLQPAMNVQEAEFDNRLKGQIIVEWHDKYGVYRTQYLE